MKDADNRRLFIVSVLMVSHPAFFLLVVCNGFRHEGAGNMPGAAFIGVLLGFMLLKLRPKVNPDLKSAGGFIFLTCPLFLFLLTSVKSDLVAVNFNTNFFWLVFVFIYLTAGAVLYIKNSTGSPDLNANNTDKTNLYAAALFVPLLIFALLVNFITRGTLYSVDSYSYYEMSRTIFGDFGLVNATRQYTVFTDYGISFPYLFPAAIAVFDFFTGFGIFSGTCVNITAALVSFYLILKISSRLSKSPIPGLLVSFVLFFNTDYLSEITAARAVPLSLLCALLVLDIISGAVKPGGKELFLAGLFAGAGIVVRFDFLVITGLLGAGWVIIFKKKFLKPVIFYALGALVFTAPWIIYSLVHFNTLWVSDNNGTLFLISPQIPQRYFTPYETVPDMFSNFSAWFLSRQYIVMYGVTGFFSVLIRPVESILLLCAAGTGILSRGFGAGEVQKPKSGKFKALLIFTLVIYTAKSLAIFLVGYSDLRYHTETVIIIALTLLCAFYTKLAESKIWICFLALIFSVSAITNLHPAFKDGVQPKLNSAFIDTAAIVPDTGTKELEVILAKESGDISGVRLFFIYSDNDYVISTNPYRLGAFTDIKSYARISNITEERLLYLVKYYIKPNYLFVPKNDLNWLNILREHYLIGAVTDAPPLYSVGAALEELGAESVRASSFSDSNWTDGVSARSPVLLFRNSEENHKKLESAAILGVGGVYIGVASFYSDDNWIHITCDADTYELEPFAYPNVINVLK